MLKDKFSSCVSVVCALVLCAVFFTAIPSVSAKPKSLTPPLKIPFIQQSEPLPITGNRRDEDYLLNEDWESWARVLRVRDLQVYDFQSTPTEAEKRQQESLLKQFKDAGFLVKELKWQVGSDSKLMWKVSGFEARRGKEILTGLYQANGRQFLYWGHKEPESPTQKLDDKLITAVLDSKPDDVRELLKQGANPYALDYSGKSVLVVAAELNQTRYRRVVDSHVEVFRQILFARKNRAVTTTASSDVEKAIKIAASSADARAVQAFLDAGATPKQIGAALRVAASEGSRDAAQLLLPHSPREDVDAALITASYVEMWLGSAIQYPDVVQALVTRKPSQSALDTALLRAAPDDENRVVPILLKAGASVKVRDSQGYTPLMLAAGNFEQDPVRALLEAGADPNVRHSDGNTALTIAARYNWPIIIRLLLSFGADTTAQNLKGETLKSWLQKRIENPKTYPDTREELRKILQNLESSATK